MSKQFAPEYDRNEQGWVLFPLSDIDARCKVFPEAVNRHQAKANLHLVRAVIEYVSEPEQTLMDIMAGSGTILIGLLMDRRVTCIEINPEYVELQYQALDSIDSILPGARDRALLVTSACQAVLPLPADHIIFSPPYAQIMKSKGTDKLTLEKTAYTMDSYTQGALNVGQVNEFYYHHLMEGIYKKCYDSLPPGGTLTTIVKDHYKKNNKTGERERLEIGSRAVRDCEQIGFHIKGWFKWYTLGSVYTRIYRARGWETADDEDIIVLEK